MINRNTALSRNSAAVHLPYLVVAVGNPHSDEGIRWCVQYEGGYMSPYTFATAGGAERHATSLALLDVVAQNWADEVAA